MFFIVSFYGFRRNPQEFRNSPPFLWIPADSVGFLRNFWIPADSGGIPGGIISIAFSCRHCQANHHSSSTAPPSSGLTAHPLPSGYCPPIPSSQQQPLPPTLPISPANASLDAHPNPRYASHMPPIFTEQSQCEQELMEEN